MIPLMLDFLARLPHFFPALSPLRKMNSQRNLNGSIILATCRLKFRFSCCIFLVPVCLRFIPVPRFCFYVAGFMKMWIQFKCAVAHHGNLYRRAALYYWPFSANFLSFFISSHFLYAALFGCACPSPWHQWSFLNNTLHILRHEGAQHFASSSGGASSGI